MTELPLQLPPDALFTPADFGDLAFETTDDLKGARKLIGQTRALKALQLSVDVDGDGFNAYALGSPDTHRRAEITQFLTQTAATRPVPDDWCYVHAFDDPQKPVAIRFPAGEAAVFAQNVAQLIDDVQASIPAAFESDEYRHLRADIDREFDERAQASAKELNEEAKSRQLNLLMTPAGYGFAPIVDGKPIDEQEFQGLRSADKLDIEQRMKEFGKLLKQHIEQLPRWQKERRERIKELDQQVATSTIGPLLRDLEAEYEPRPTVLEYITALERDILENLRELLSGADAPMPEPMPMPGKGPPLPSARRYEVNVLVGHRDAGAAPVVYEPNPTLQNLIGRIDHHSEFGSLVTDHGLIRAGAIHRANGGFLLLDAERVLQEPYVWRALKRTLLGGEVRIEALSQLLGLISTVSLEPEPIPLDVKVILMGDRRLYYLLCEYDKEFSQLFKIAVDFDDRIERTPEHTIEFARLVAALAQENDLKPFSRDAVGRIVEHASRLAHDARKLSTITPPIGDLIREAGHRAGQSDNSRVELADVECALEDRAHRLDRVREDLQEAIRRRSILVEVTGRQVAQVNGLSVLQLGDHAFGQPTRITATVRLGDGGVLDIQREVELGGAIHSKGVLILSSLIGARYARKTPLSLSASLAFEQTYGTVDGDSASVAELCALLSALADCPLEQSLAVTGSVNQRGEVQVIGGVNEKIEGFFDVCRQNGWTGHQGVIIPCDNRDHLMLRGDVVDAVREGTFRVLAVNSVDEALELLTGMPAGAADAQGDFPEGSFNARVCAAVAEFAQLRRAFSGSGQDKGEP